jgi:hypothetical protein
MRCLGRDVPRGIAVSEALLTLARLAQHKGAYKLARFAYGKLQARSSDAGNLSAEFTWKMNIAPTMRTCCMC